ncbi:hypothetical protein [Candidatus Pelagibacter sp.]|uniref:hypothetical protein n=1 Tax=Candidatus Pelagibacter sp. TaxID=2024849 RepID=UPI003F85EDC0
MLSLKEQKIFIKKIIDKMIPNNKLYKMPAASKVINFNIFFNQIRENTFVIKEFKKINRIDKDQLILSNRSSILNNSVIENEISTELLENYFSSKKILKILDEKSKKISFGKKKDKLEEKKLTKYIKKIYKI